MSQAQKQPKFEQDALGHYKNKINKQDDSFTNKLSSDLDEIQKIFRDYYQNLYSQPKTVDKDKIRQYLLTLDFPSIGSIHGHELTAPITRKEPDTAISRLKTNKCLRE